MWKQIIDPNKEITVNCKLKQMSEGIEKIYNTNIVEYDQFHIQLLNKNNFPVTEVMRMTLSPKQILDYKFQVEVK